MSDYEKMLKMCTDMELELVKINSQMAELNKRRFMWILVWRGKDKQSLVRVNLETGESEQVKVYD